MSNKKQLPKQEPQEGSRYRVQFDFGYRGSQGKQMSPDSDTVPEMSLTVRQLLENHTRGKDSNVEVRQPLYFDVPVPTITDITDVENYRKQLEETLRQTNEFIKKDKENAKSKLAEKTTPKSGENNTSVPEKSTEENTKA